jgi:CO/xanthine dehydrogenase FAD-binding subunit
MKHMIEYLFPESIEEAVRCLAARRGEAQVIAGGTDVMADLRRRKINPSCLVDITRIPGLDRIEVTEERVNIGAAVTFAQIKESPVLQTSVPALVDAARSVGAIGIQAAATWSGNIVQAMPAADGAIIALALDAEAHIVDAKTSEWQPVESLFAGPGASAVDPTRQMITHIRFPRLRAAWGTAWRRVGRRPSLVLPIINCAASLQFEGDVPGAEEVSPGTIAHAAIALGPVGPRPFRARRAEAFLMGQVAGADVLAQAACIARDEANPRSSIMRASRDYRLAVIPPLVEEALRAATARAVMSVGKAPTTAKTSSTPSAAAH